MLDIRRSTLGVIFNSTPKKYRPPRPMGVKGGCSPQNNLPKSAQLLTELNRCRNKNFYKLYCSYGAIVNRHPSTRKSSNEDFSSCGVLPERFTSCGSRRCAF